MTTVDEAVIARLDKGGEHFEVLVDPELAFDLKAGKKVSISEMLAVNDVFRDSKKGKKIDEDSLEDAFGTFDPKKIARIIVKKGDVQLTTALRKKKQEARKKQVANFISKYGMNPQTKSPNPPERILNAMDQARVNIDPFRPVSEQAQEVVSQIKDIVPISFEKLQIEVHIPAQYSGRAYGILKKYDLSKSEWRNDGSLYAVVSIPAGLENELYSKLNSVTDGNVETKKL